MYENGNFCCIKPFEDYCCNPDLTEDKDFGQSFPAKGTAERRRGKILFSK